jgi:DNA-binding NtrC family response regulator
LHLDDYTSRDSTDVADPVAAAAAGFSLYALSDERVATFALPEAGDVPIGRATDSAIILDRTDVSRRHATLIMGDDIQLVDNGSANGTRLRGEALAPHTPMSVSPGDVIEIGGLMLVVRPRFEVGKELAVCEHDYFERRVQEECDRSAVTGDTFAVLRARLEDGHDPARFERAVQRARPLLVVGRYGPRDYEVLLVGDEGEAIAFMRAVSRSCERDALIDWGVGRYPRDGLDAHELVARANQAIVGRRSSGHYPIVVAAPAMREIHRLAAQVARSDINVLVLGETGVGKEVLAQTIHEQSTRAKQPLARVCCASLTPTLIESELFGHVKGAFTGASVDHVGLLQSANGGTVFLDEIGELDLHIQAKLLRVLEDKIVRPVGSVSGTEIDVRFVSATNRELEADVKAGRFRRDLFYRLNGFCIVIPPLRERVGEIGQLARSLMRQAGSSAGITPDAVEFLENQRWPGNVRELRNTIERAVILSGGADIEPEHLRGGRPRARSRPKSESGAQEILNMREAVEATERRLIEKALVRAGGEQSKAAKILGISRQKLVARMDAYKIPRPRKPAAR